MYFYTLKTKQVEKTGLLKFTRIACRKYICGGSLGCRFLDGAFAFQVKVLHKQFSVDSGIMHTDKKRTLHDVVIITDRPLCKRKRRIGTKPCALRVSSRAAYVACARVSGSLCLIKSAYCVVRIRRI